MTVAGGLNRTPRLHAGVPESLTDRIAEFRDRLAILPEADEPPPTTLQVLGRGHQEQDWQRLLFHLLSPDAAHGLEHALLEHLLVALSEREDLAFTFSRFDLDDIQVEQEVITASGRPDGIIWSATDWFICWELKVTASEGDEQTPGYVDDPVFRSIDLEKDDVPDGGHHYVYLAPADASGPAAADFVHVSWEWVAAELQAFLAESHGEHPARTTAQIDDFIETIRTQLTMTDYQENQREKVRLYIDHYDEISEVADAFEERWSEFEDTWGTRLAQRLETAEIVEDAAVPDEYAPVELELANGEKRRWTFRQGHSDWSWMPAREWWTKLDERRPTYDTSKPNARVGYLHRLEWHRDDVLADQTLNFYLRNAPSGHEDFYDNFASRFNGDDAIPEMLPAVTTRPDVKSNVLEAAYDINTEPHDSFFTAYIDALARAMDDHVVSNPELVNTIDSHYQKTIEKDTPH